MILINPLNPIDVSDSKTSDKKLPEYPSMLISLFITEL
jgi:hypothetical protein